MLAYTLWRLVLMVPTIIGVVFISFVISNFVPGGPVDRMVAQIQGAGSGANTEAGAGSSSGGETRARGLQGFDAGIRAEIERQFGYDKPAPERFWLLLKGYARFDMGRSLFSQIPVGTLIAQKLPVSVSLGVWMTLLSYLISIPLGIRKAVRDGSRFDVGTSFAVSVGFAIPSFLWAVLLATLFCSANLPLFPQRGLTSDNFAALSLAGKVGDYIWHVAMPVTALTLGSFATVTALTKNAFLDEIGKNYVLTARMKGLSERGVLYGHLFRNSMMIVIAGFPGAFVGAFFTGALLIEYIFSLDGLGRMSYEAVINRDYPIVFANIYIFALIGLVVNLVSDLTYTWIDPRIDFARREV